MVESVKSVKMSDFEDKKYMQKTFVKPKSSSVVVIFERISTFTNIAKDKRKVVNSSVGGEFLSGW